MPAGRRNQVDGIEHAVSKEAMRWCAGGVAVCVDSRFAQRAGVMNDWRRVVGEKRLPARERERAQALDARMLFWEREHADALSFDNAETGQARFGPAALPFV